MLNPDDLSHKALVTLVEGLRDVLFYDSNAGCFDVDKPCDADSIDQITQAFAAFHLIPGEATER